jgi:hypothetical protein
VKYAAIWRLRIGVRVSLPTTRCGVATAIRAVSTGHTDGGAAATGAMRDSGSGHHLSGWAMRCAGCGRGLNAPIGTVTSIG